jgi:hypothetical protein
MFALSGGASTSEAVKRKQHEGGTDPLLGQFGGSSETPA